MGKSKSKGKQKNYEVVQLNDKDEKQLRSIIYVHVRDLKPNKFFMYNGYVYYGVFDKTEKYLSFIMCVSEENMDKITKRFFDDDFNNRHNVAVDRSYPVDEEDYFLVDEDGNMEEPTDDNREIKGFFILPNGGIAFDFAESTSSLFLSDMFDFINKNI